jgi:hypothetical protein
MGLAGCASEGTPAGRCRRCRAWRRLGLKGAGEASVGCRIGDQGLVVFKELSLSVIHASPL